MRHLILAALLMVTFLFSIAPAQAGLRRLTLGGNVGVFFPVELHAYGGDGEHYFERMNADTLESLSFASFSVEIFQSLRLGRYFRLELSERVWWNGMKAEFAGTPHLDYALSRWVFPFALQAQVIVGLEPATFRMGLGPGLYVLHTRESGYFGKGRETDVALGFRGGLGVDIWLAHEVGLCLDLSFDYFEMPGQTRMLEDGGFGGGVSFLIGVRGLLWTNEEPRWPQGVWHPEAEQTAYPPS